MVPSSCLYSGTKKEPKPKLFGPDIFRWGRGLPREGVGAKIFGMSLETREIKLFGRDIPGFCRDIPEVPEKFEKKKFVFNSCPLCIVDDLGFQTRGARPPLQSSVSPTILFRITTRMKISISNKTGDCSCSFQGSSEFIKHYSCSFPALLAECSYRK